MIMIVGVSASGKTHTIQKLFQRMPTLIHLRASSILRSFGRPLQNPTINETIQNQIVLIKYLQQERTSSGVILLDSHAMIETSEGPLLLPDWTFDGLKPSQIIHIEEDSEIIAKRRSKQGRSIESSQVIELQTLERNHAWNQSARLGIPFAQVRSGDDEKLAINLARAA